MARRTTPAVITPDNSKKVVVTESGCWLWTGNCDKSGYSHVGRQGKRYLGHRYNWIMTNGEIPEGLEIHHICTVRNCIRPEHLQAVTHEDNIRAYADLNNTCSKGHPYDIVRTDTRSRSRGCSICIEEYQANYNLKRRKKNND